MEIFKRVLSVYLQADNAAVFIVMVRRNFMQEPSKYCMIEMPKFYTVIY
jgi:hypothetical protein